MKHYSETNSFELAEKECDALLQLQSKLFGTPDNIGIMNKQIEEYRLLLFKCSAWIEYITNFVDLTYNTYNELSKLLSKINDTLEE